MSQKTYEEFLFKCNEARAIALRDKPNSDRSRWVLIIGANWSAFINDPSQEINGMPVALSHERINDIWVRT